MSNYWGSVHIRGFQGYFFTFYFLSLVRTECRRRSRQSLALVVAFAAAALFVAEPVEVGCPSYRKIVAALVVAELVGVAEVVDHNHPALAAG